MQMTELRPDNHTLWTRVQHLVSLKRSWEYIAEDIGGVTAKEVVEWVLAYKGRPKRPLVRSAQLREPTPKPTSVAVNTAQFIAWRKQHEGARKTLEAAGQ